MRAHHVMTRDIVTVSPEANVIYAANVMLRHHISGLPVVDSEGKLVGIVSEGDFLRRGEIGTEKRRNRWLSFLAGAGGLATEYVKEHGRKVADVMTRHVLTVNEYTPLEDIIQLMEKNQVKRVPVMRGSEMVGIVTRSNLMHAVASLAGEIPEPTAIDDRIRDRIVEAIQSNDWQPIGLEVIVKDGVVHLSGLITDERFRQAAIVAAENVDGVRLVHDHLSWVEPMSGLYMLSPEDQSMSTANDKGSSAAPV